MIVDTGILVDLLRGEIRAAEYLSKIKTGLIVSRLSIMELIRGTGSKREMVKLMKQLDGLIGDIIEVDKVISKKAGDIFQSGWHSNSIGIIDSLIAATAFVLDETLVTRNIKYFKHVEDIKLEKPY